MFRYRLLCPQDLQGLPHHVFRRKTEEVNRVSPAELLSLDLAPVYCHVLDHLLPFKFRHHALVQRLRDYQGRRSRCGCYVELYGVEAEEIMGYTRVAPDPGKIRVVEIGLNCDREVCKIAIVLYPNVCNRYLFLCLGMDSGLKTMYLSPYYKRCRGGIPDPFLPAPPQAPPSQTSSHNPQIFPANPPPQPHTSSHQSLSSPSSPSSPLSPSPPSLSSSPVSPPWRPSSPLPC